MKYIITFILSFALLVLGCGNGEKAAKEMEEKREAQKAAKKTACEACFKNYVATNPTGDTTVLDFVWGWSKEQTNNHVKKLIKDGRLGNKANYTLRVLYENIEVNGYTYPFQFNETASATGLVNPFFSDSKLSSIEFLFVRNSEKNQNYEDEDMLDFFKKIYGEPCCKKKTSEGLGTEKYHWYRNKEHIIVTDALYNSVKFLSIDAEKKELELAKILKEAKEAADELTTEINKTDF